ncbi:MAG: hypothetical protein ACTSUE_14075 [Promethearchaeota archaeon]
MSLKKRKRKSKVVRTRGKEERDRNKDVREKKTDFKTPSSVEDCVSFFDKGEDLTENKGKIPKTVSKMFETYGDDDGDCGGKCGDIFSSKASK